MLNLFPRSISLSVILSTVVQALNPILIKDNIFYDSVTNQRFFIKGVDYQPKGELGIDPLVDPEICLRDLFLLQQLGANAIRFVLKDLCISGY